MFYAVEYLQHFLTTNEKSFQLFKWLGNISIFAGAGSIALSITFSMQMWPFVLAVLGSIIWLLAAITMRERALAWYQVFFISINSYAIYLRA